MKILKKIVSWGKNINIEIIAIITFKSNHIFKAF